MQYKAILTCILISCLYSTVQALDFATVHNNSLLLNNGIIEREIFVENGAIFTKRFKAKDNELNFITDKSKEFSININGKYYDGQSGWDLLSIETTSDKNQGNGATIKLQRNDSFSSIEVHITYLLCPDLPVIRKKIGILNNTGEDIMIESLDVEKLILNFDFTNAIAYTNYGRQKHLSTYIGNWDDPVIAIHSYSLNAGIILGNESPGVLKRTAYNTEYNNIEIGLTHKDEEYPFRKYVKNSEQWICPWVFVIPYVDSPDPWNIMNTSLADFTRCHMGLRINELEERPTVMYNNWNPFRNSINDSLILNLAKIASEIGVSHFAIDAGWYTTKGNNGKDVSWQENLGDYIVDKTKFPDGLKPIFSQISEMGMKPGLWIGLGAAAKSSKVLQDHPEWAIRDEKGNLVNLHSPDVKKDQWTMCFGTEWKEYIKNKILDLVRDLGLKYIKLDLAVITSAYVTNPDHSGCYATGHQHHKDHKESLIVIYERIFELFDELHDEAPGLYIDCTFETAGKLQLIDYAFCQHAEGNWLTNIYEDFPVGSFRIRNLAWWKSPVIPASSLIIGNLKMDSPEFTHGLKSLIGSFPITLGDLRNLPKDKKMEIRQWTDWISKMQDKYNYDLFRQDLPGFGEPMEGAWDGWLRINTDTKEGGIIGVFKQGSLDSERTISVPGLDPIRKYYIKNAPESKEIIIMSGKELEEEGFKVKMANKYDSKLFEVEMLK